MVGAQKRGANLMRITVSGNFNMEDTVEFIICTPKTNLHFTASLAVILLQFLGYDVSVTKGMDVDKTSNLAKSVTVE